VRDFLLHASHCVCERLVSPSSRDGIASPDSITYHNIGGNDNGYRLNKFFSKFTSREREFQPVSKIWEEQKAKIYRSAALYRRSSATICTNKSQTSAINDDF
jgi:hypothetical protein